MKTITSTDEQFAQVEKRITQAKEVKKEVKTTIYKTDGSVLYESNKDSLREAVIEAVDGGANLREANLWEADLWEADLREANLWEADLWEADLREANLWEADLREANLREADLREAELCSAKFYGKGGTSKLKKNQVEDFLNALGFQIID